MNVNGTSSNYMVQTMINIENLTKLAQADIIPMKLTPTTDGKVQTEAMSEAMKVISYTVQNNLVLIENANISSQIDISV